MQPMPYRQMHCMLYLLVIKTGYMVLRKILMKQKNFFG